MSVRQTLFQGDMMRHFAVLIVMASATMAASQITKHLPIAKQTGVRAVSESSLRWFPQIQPSFRIGAPTPRNPQFPNPPIEEPNSLPVGLNSNTIERVKPGPLFPGITATGWVPADPNIAVGPNHVVQVVNTDIAWFDKATGAKQFQVGMEPIAGPTEGFFESLNPFPFVFDPKCFYDKNTNRFFVVALELDDASQTSKALVAVSDDSNPNGTWFKYRFEAKLTVSGNASWMDYPGFGCNKDAIVVTGNMFGFTTGFPGVQAIVIPKAPLLTGGAATASQILIPNVRTVQVCHTFDAALDKIYMISQANTTNALTLYAVVNPGGSPTISQANVSIPSWTPASIDPISAGGRTFDSFDGRLFEADYRAGRVVTTHHVAVSPTDNRNMVRWYEVNTNNFPASMPTLSQSGNVIGASGQHFHMPGIGVNSAGDIALVFTRSSSTIVADVMVCGRLITDAPGFMSAPNLVKNSAGPTYGNTGFNRWGDYFSMEVDPTDDLTFWSVAMLGQSNGNWTTEISKMTISDIDPIGSFIDHNATAMNIYVDPVTNPATQGQGLVGALANVFTSDNLYASMNSVSVPRVGHVAAYEFTYQTDTSKGTPKGIVVRTETSAPTGVTGMVWLYDWNTGKYVQFASFSLKANVDVKYDATAAAPFARFVSPTGLVKAVVRGLSPQKTGRGNPIAFTYKADVATLRVRY